MALKPARTQTPFTGEPSPERLVLPPGGVLFEELEEDHGGVKEQRRDWIFTLYELQRHILLRISQYLFGLI